MQTTLRWLRRSALALGALLLVAAVAALAYRSYRQADNARFLRLDTPDAVVEAGFVAIGGAQQWVQIRGEDRSNPVLLLVAGGPGWSTINQVYRETRAWERNFTVVQWDQRGAGRTHLFSSEPPGQPIARYVADGIEVAEYVRGRLGETKPVILGWSWGSLLGTEMARARPDLFCAYVGSGQIVNMQANEEVGYRRLMERLTAAGARDAAARLRAIGPPPFPDMDSLFDSRMILMTHPIESETGLLPQLITASLFAPGYRLLDTYRIATAQVNIDPAIVAEFADYDIAVRGLRFDIPMLYLQGAEDIQTPTELVVPYVERIVAPRKELVLLPEAGHWAPIYAAEAFLDELEKRVLPLTVAAGCGA